MKIQLSNITEYQDSLCKLFAKYSVVSSQDEYKKRNQHNKQKIISDIYNGKKGEFMVYNYYDRKNKNITYPDIAIYDKSRKSYDCDLTVDGYNLHVKTHVKNDMFPVSWLFQKKDELTKRPGEKDYIAFCVISDENYMYIKPAEGVNYKEPVKESLKANKLCVYEKDL